MKLLYKKSSNLLTFGDKNPQFGILINANPLTNKIQTLLEKHTEQTNLAPYSTDLNIFNLISRIKPLTKDIKEFITKHSITTLFDIANNLPGNSLLEREFLLHTVGALIKDSNYFYTYLPGEYSVKIPQGVHIKLFNTPIKHALISYQDIKILVLSQNQKEEPIKFNIEYNVIIGDGATLSLVENILNTNLIVAIDNINTLQAKAGITEYTKTKNVKINPKTIKETPTLQVILLD